MERQWDTDLRKYSTVMNWKSEESDLTTSIQLLGYNDSKTRFLVTADRDGSVRVFDSAGNVVERRDFSGSVWDMVPANLDNESDLELVLGMFKKLSVVKGASELWSYPVESRFSRVGAYDLDKDGYAEVLGVSENTLYLFDSRGNLLWKRDFESVGGFDFVYVESVNYTGIAVADNSRVLLLSKDGISGGSYDLGENARALHYYSYGGKSGLVVGTDSSIKYFSFDVSGLLREDAQSLEGTAFEFFYAGRFNDSVEAALRAQEKFSELGDFEALGRLEELVENSSDIMEAEGFYMRARAYFLNGDYNSSTGNANEALKLFRRSGYASGVEKSMALVAGVGEKELADSFYRMAEESYVGSNLSGVVENVDKAIAIYERVNFTQGIEKSRALAYAARLNFNSSAQSTQTTVETPYTTVTFRRANAGGTAEDMTFYAAIVLSVLVVAYAAYSVLKKR